jgi:hypothetical protein
MNEVLSELNDRISKKPQEGFVESFKNCQGVECFEGTGRKKYQGFIFEPISAWEEQIDAEFNHKVECVNNFDEDKKSIAWYRESDQTILKIDEVPDHRDLDMPDLTTYRSDICMFVIENQEDFESLVDKIVMANKKSELEEEEEQEENP